MPTIDLNSCFPAPEDTALSRGPLPKQREFMNKAMDPHGPKYVLYAGGVGSGKTLIGCITVLSLAVMYPGDYLVCRLFNPELKITTYKTFLEICPKELIVEHRMADQILRIRNAQGTTSNIIFRGLEEPDKHRSLNLNLAYIDEASQVSEAAFTLLQSRLRGRHIRKIIMTTNPNGHSWLYRMFIKQDFTNPEAKKLFYSISAPTTENFHLSQDYVQSMLSTYSEDRVKREVYASWDAFEGQVYHEFRRDTHVIKPFRIPDEWTRIAGVDHGYRNPSAWVFGAVDYDGNIYIYKEYYESGKLIKDICSEVRQLIGKTKINGAFIDPSTKAHRGQSGESDFDLYLDYLPKDFPLILANNEKTAGIDRVKSYLRVDEKTNKPSLYIFDTCDHVIDEITQYRYQELTTSQMGKVNEKEEPVKVEDHAVDALRYLIMSRPEKPKKEVGKQKLRDEFPIFRELDDIRNPKPKDPWGDV